MGSRSLSSSAFWARSAAERAATFAELRRSEPVSWQDPAEGTLAPQPQGFWAVTCHGDVQHVSRAPDAFCSGGVSGSVRSRRRSWSSTRRSW